MTNLLMRRVAEWTQCTMSLFYLSFLHIFAYEKCIDNTYISNYNVHNDLKHTTPIKIM